MCRLLPWLPRHTDWTCFGKHSLYRLPHYPALGLCWFVARKPVSKPAPPPPQFVSAPSELAAHCGGGDLIERNTAAAPGTADSNDRGRRGQPTCRADRNSPSFVRGNTARLGVTHHGSLETFGGPQRHAIAHLKAGKMVIPNMSSVMLGKSVLF